MLFLVVWAGMIPGLMLLGEADDVDGRFASSMLGQPLLYVFLGGWGLFGLVFAALALWDLWLFVHWVNAALKEVVHADERPYIRSVALTLNHAHKTWPTTDAVPAGIHRVSLAA
jgi:hypothetical protein